VATGRVTDKLSHLPLSLVPFSLTFQIVYFGRAIPWVIIDAMPSMRKYKLQDVSLFVLFEGESNEISNFD